MAANTASPSSSTTRGGPVPKDTSTTTTAALLLEQYKALLARHLRSDDPVGIKEVLSTTTSHALWQDLAALFEQYNSDDNALLQSLLDAIHANHAHSYSLPLAARARNTPKRAARVCDKIRPCPAHRSNFCDWMACRMTCHYDEFAQAKRDLVASLAPDTVIVWRYNYDSANDSTADADIMHMGYAYRPGALAVMECQIVEPVAAWVFTSNSLHKHAGLTGRVTFKESKALYNACKAAILHHDGNIPQADLAMLQDVKAYYQAQRAVANHNAAPLDLEELQKLQTLINERFFSTSSQQQQQQQQEKED